MSRAMLSVYSSSMSFISTVSAGSWQGALYATRHATLFAGYSSYENGCAEDSQ